MPASGVNLYHMQDAKNNFNAMRPAPVCTETNQFMGQCHNIPVSTNCYYGYHDAKRTMDASDSINKVDCEMVEVPRAPQCHEASVQSNARKRGADDEAYPQNKRLREEVQRKTNIEPETSENMGLDSSSEEFMENLYWHIHGGNIFHLLQCV